MGGGEAIRALRGAAEVGRDEEGQCGQARDREGVREGGETCRRERPSASRMLEVLRRSGGLIGLSCSAYALCKRQRHKGRGGGEVRSIGKWGGRRVDGTGLLGGWQEGHLERPFEV